MQPSELDRMEFYRAEILMENFKDWNEKEQEHRKKEEKEQESSQPSFNSSSMTREAGRMFNSAQSGMPNFGSMGNLGNFKI